ncbi:hypothetical protein VPNG_03441 [Cytospora leucostoma]|uniref:Uncharacterized protein n=1 Tax=Cytospora leucostoma TaxID=1230097 RepID=A0A423XFH9_9PEZI|nr:hypothetical protein VPNG_03441 [Cytospora leucostoma]
MTIRSGDSVYQCLANLTVALEQVGQLNSAEYNGAAGALSLLPTAGALLGAPTREMWIVYKLVPLAGVLSMFLGLGASITPSNVGDYDPEEPFSYGGFMPTTRLSPAERDPPSRRTSLDEFQQGGSPIQPMVEEPKSPADVFADEVKKRAGDDRGGGFLLGVWMAMILQFTLIIVILVPMYYAQRGSVITWWCRVWGWMWFWYFLITVVSVFDNIIAAPFTHSWTIRVSRRPTGIILDRDHNSPRITDTSRHANALECLEANPNTSQRILISNSEATTYSRTCFYVVISVQGISTLHAIAQILSKGASVAVFAFGTALFASATMLSISVALMVLCLLLPSGVAGRVVAMWIVSQVSRQNKPILHKMVKSKAEAAKYFHAIAKQDIQMEAMGHVILDGYIVKSRSKWFSAATYIGLLATPYDVIALAEKSSRGLHYSAANRPSFVGMQPPQAFMSPSFTGRSEETTLLYNP